MHNIGANIVRSKLCIGDVATEWFAEEYFVRFGIICE